MGRYAEGRFMGAEIGEFNEAVIVCDQNVSCWYRLLCNLRGENCHGQRVEYNVAVVKFP